MTTPDPAAFAQLAMQVTAHRGQLTLLDTRLKNLAATVAGLTQTVTDTLDAATPKGRPPICWDTLDQAEHDRELEKLQRWVGHTLTRRIAGGPWTLPGCWDQHPYAIEELSLLSEQWRQVYGPAKPGPLKDALEFADRWIPGVMARVTAATRSCTPIHRSAT